jgi:hypothetical protein
MGSSAAKRRSVLALAADVRPPRLRHLPALPRSPASGAAAGHAAAPVHAPRTLPVQRCRDRRADPGRRPDAPRARRHGDLPDPDRAARRDGHAARRGLPAGPRPLQPPRPHAHDRPQQVRQDPPAAPGPDHGDGPGRIRTPPRPAAPAPGRAQPAGLDAGHPDGHHPHRARLRPAGPRRRDPAAVGPDPPDDEEPEAHLRGQHADQLVPLRRRCRGPAAGPVHLARPR